MSDLSNPDDHEIADAARALVGTRQVWRPDQADTTFTVTVGLDEWRRFEQLVRSSTTGASRG